MKYREIGEVFKKGKHWYKVIEITDKSYKPYESCSLSKKCSVITTYCAPSEREDNKNVFYKKVKNPNKKKQENKDLPCPFCGSTSNILAKHKDDCYLLMTHNYYTNKGYYTPQQMETAYNTRYNCRYIARPVE